MSNKTSNFDKRGTIYYVISKLDGIQKHKKKVEKLKECKDLDKCYKDSLRYGRLYIHHDQERERDEFFKDSHWLGKKLEREENSKTVLETKSDGNMIKENKIDNEFISEIEKVDMLYKKQDKVIDEVSTNENSLVKRLLEFGVTKLNIDILNDCKVNYKIVGCIGDSKVCYMSEFDKIVEIINSNSYVEQK